MLETCYTEYITVLVFVICHLAFCKSPKMMKAAQFEPGGPEKLTIGEVPIPHLREREVLIKVCATAINRADTLQRKGFYPPPPGESDILGLEAAGVIDQVSPSSTEKWKKGDRVMALLAGGGNAEFVASPEYLLMSIPKNMDFKEAAAIPEVWLTAYQLLHTISHVKSGETVLIHGGGSGVGTAAVQLVSLANAKPIVTAGSESKIETARSLGAVAGFNYKEGDFSEKVLQLTDGKGVDIILDCVGGSFYEKNINSIASDGRWVLYGLLGGGSISGDIFSKILRKRVTLTGSTLRIRNPEYKTKLVKNFSEDILPHFASGKLRPLIHTVFSLEQLGEAHKMMEENKNTGKIVIQVIQDSSQTSGKDEF